MAPEIAVVVRRDAAEERIAPVTAVAEDVRDHGARGCFAMRTCYADVERTVGDHTQHILRFTTV